jgi:SAM-dependent methyltransferase
VGPNGHVLATDLDTRFLDTLAQPNLTVQRHDIAVDPLPDMAFDLIHTRLVLNHLPTRDQVLARVLTGLKPGGWLLAEEFDAFSLPPDPAVQPEEVRVPLLAAMYQVMEARGIDLHYGRKLRSRMQAAGLVDLGAEGRVVLAPGGSLIAQGFQASLIQLRETILVSGLLTPAAYDRDLHCLSDPAIVTLWPLLWAVWGWRPSP